MKILTVVGTRPEIIRLSATIKLLDQHVEHVLVHTGQNYDFELNQVFFEDLELRQPDYFLAADVSSLGAALGSIIARLEPILTKESPDAFLVLGDTNSSISAVIAKRMQIPVFHMEAGNRCFDSNVPEETNRRLVDHVADYNLVYTEHARRNLLAEGIHPSRILLTGSPMREVINQNQQRIDASDVLERQGLTAGQYFLASVHREENVDNTARLTNIVLSLNAISEEYQLPVLVSTHPRTRRRLRQLTTPVTHHITLHKPFGFHDYIKLQRAAKCVLSDSGTISEESSMLDFPAVTLRDSIERPEALDSGTLITAGLEPQHVLAAVAIEIRLGATGASIAEYTVTDTARRTLKFILGSVHSHRQRLGLRSTSLNRLESIQVHDSSVPAGYRLND